MCSSNYLGIKCNRLCTIWYYNQRNTIIKCARNEFYKTNYTIYNIDRPTWFNVLLDPILFLCLFNLLLHTISTINIITPKGTTAKITSNATRSISQVSITRPKFHSYLNCHFCVFDSYQFSSSLIRPPIQLVQTNRKPVPD